MPPSSATIERKDGSIFPTVCQEGIYEADLSRHEYLERAL